MLAIGRTDEASRYSLLNDGWHFIIHSWFTSFRCAKNTLRQPTYIVVMLTQPLIWLIFMDAAFHQVVRLNNFPMSQYVTYLAPGVIAMSALFSGGINGTGMLRDITHGVLDQLLTLPISRSALICGRVGLQIILTILQTTIIICVAIALGARFSNGITGIALLYLLSITLGCALAMLSNGGALILRNEQALSAIMNFALFPVTFLSTAFMPGPALFGWIAEVARYNPLNWAATAARDAISVRPDWESVATNSSLLAAFAILCAAFALYSMTSYRRNALSRGANTRRGPQERMGRQETITEPVDPTSPQRCPLNRIDCAILAELAAGYPQDVAARRLGMSPRTIRRKLNSICIRIDVETTIEAVAWAARRRLI